MLRYGRSLRCLRGDLGTGKPSPYHPRYRPRRLVMPVDTSSVHSTKRASNFLLEKHRSLERLKRISVRRGALTLATVPCERSVGDAFRQMLEVCEKEELFNPRVSFELKAYRKAHQLVEEYNALEKELKSDKFGTSGGRGLVPWLPQREETEEDRTFASAGSALNALGLSARRDLASIAGEENEDQRRAALAIRKVDQVWRMLDRTPLNSPVHGALALRGKALVEGTIARDVYEAFPRLRSKNIQQLLHESAGLLPCGRVATRLGFADFAGVSAEIGMWRELNVLTERFRTARRMAAAHLQRIRLGVVQQRRWYWRGVLKSAAGRLKMFPVHQEDIQPRMEWVRSSLFAFIAFVELAEQSGERNMNVHALIIKLFCSQLGVHITRTQLLQRMAAIAAVEGAPSGSDSRKVEAALDGNDAKWRRFGELPGAIDRELRRIASLTTDELEVLNEQVHPLNARADRRMEQFQSSGGAHATQSLRDDIFDDFRVTRHYTEAPSIVIHAIQPLNAFKEAQIILRYDPFVPASLRKAPIDVDQVIRRTVEVHETNPYATLSFQQQFRQTEYTVCRLMAGSRCLGEGKGETDMLAMNEAALHMLLNYYLKPPPERGADPSATEGSITFTHDSSSQSDYERKLQNAGSGVDACSSENDPATADAAQGRTNVVEDVEIFF